MSRAVRPRRGRIAAFWTSVVVTAVSVLGGIGVLPASDPAAAEAGPGSQLSAIGLAGAAAPQEVEPGVTLQALPAPSPEPAASPEPTGEVLTAAPGLTGDDLRVDPRALVAGIDPAHPLPRDSGSGRRVVFDISEQRVWLVDARGAVRRSHLASGSVTDNLRPGTYEVYSRSRHAVGIDDSGTMEFMVRFTRGERAAIGFHSIPVLDGELVQSRDELGTPLSHGCIRQWRPDARALWDFAPVGTTVVVTA